MFHALWIVLAQTLDESGIYELRQIERGDAFGSTVELQQTRIEAEALRQKINDEALHGALRISALVSAAGCHVTETLTSASIGFRSDDQQLPSS